MSMNHPSIAPELPLERRSWILGLGLAAVSSAALMAACNGGHGSFFTRLAKSQHLAADLRVQFNKATDASNRSVMAETDEASIAFAAEAAEAKTAVQRDLEALIPVLQELAHPTELQILEQFRTHFAEYEKVDRAILELAVQNSNLKAQKLSFGPGREAGDALRASLDAFALATSPKNACGVCPLVYAAVVAVREIQVLEAPHIPQPDDAVMTKMEKEMDALEATARSALRTLAALGKAEGGQHLSAATAALDRFWETHTKIIALSRQNTNVRSLAMSLGDKRVVITACENNLTTLQNTLAHDGIKATR